MRHGSIEYEHNCMYISTTEYLIYICRYPVSDIPPIYFWPNDPISQGSAEPNRGPANLELLTKQLHFLPLCPCQSPYPCSLLITE
jgi:hypothetical protein